MYKSLLLCVLCLGCIPASGTSISCPIASLATYEAPGFSCREGPLRFSDFTFLSSVTGDALQLTDVGVVPLTLADLPLVNQLTGDGLRFDQHYGFLFGDEYSFLFSGPFQAGDPDALGGSNCLQSDAFGNCLQFTPGGTEETFVSYNVQGPVVTASNWMGPTLSGSDFGSMALFWGLNTTFTCPSGPSCLPGLGSSADAYAPYANISTAGCSPICTSLVVSNDFLVLAKPGNVAFASGFVNGYSVPPVSEPSSLLLLGTGLLGLVWRYVLIGP